MTFNTGDSQDKGRKLLRRAFSFIHDRYHSAITYKSFEDRRGVFGKIMELSIRIVDRSKFFRTEPPTFEVSGSVMKIVLVARGTRPFKGVISTQREALEYASAEGIPLCVCYWVEKAVEPYFYLFDAGAVLKGDFDENSRFDSLMVNYSMSLGRRWML